MKALVFLPYFGKFPNYLDLWMLSASKNSEYLDFLIITDQKIKSSFDNIKVINMDFNELKTLFQSKFDFKINLENHIK